MKKTTVRLKEYPPYPMGVRRNGSRILLVAAFGGHTDCGIVFYGADGKICLELTLEDRYRHGSVYSVAIEGVPEKAVSYMLREQGRLFPDPYARTILGLSGFGRKIDTTRIRCELREDDAPLEDPAGRPRTAYEDSFYYGLHVRGFTKSASSGLDAQERGTFTGLMRKIPYLKSLGVTGVELMPVYELCPQTQEGDLRIAGDGQHDLPQVLVENGSLRALQEDGKPKVNFWGFAPGYYFAPRTAYCRDKLHPAKEFADMVRAFHEAGMEVILQFFFPAHTSVQLILDSLRFWVIRFGIDGIHCKGPELPMDAIASDPCLSDTKLWYYGFDYRSLYGTVGGKPETVTLAEYHDGFARSCRRFLKGNDGEVSRFVNEILLGGKDHSRISYICNYDGFRLMDLVSYEHKHNEANGEQNADGEDCNDSWNCGQEGPTRRKLIQELRLRQMKNALTMLFFAQGAPFLFSGDEFGDTQNGNNNPYCQDNAIGWVDWKKAESHADLLDYVRFLSGLRSKYSILRKAEPYRLMDYKTCGYPDLSFHGTDSWRPDLGPYSHSIGLLFWGAYSGEEDEQDALYVIFNMHWKAVRFTLPSLPEGMTWYRLFDTSVTGDQKVPEPAQPQDSYLCGARSCTIMIGKGTGTTCSKRNRKSPN